MSKVQNLIYSFLVLFSVTILVACENVKHQVNLDGKFKTSPEMKIEVGKVSNACGESFDINIEEMLTSAFTIELEKKGMLWRGEPGSKLTLETKIIEYPKGDAFNRWLWFMPGWGATVLTIQTDLKEADKIIGTVEARRYVYAGGESIATWETIFASIAKDVVADFEAQIKKKNI
jgi:hypothetical protein